MTVMSGHEPIITALQMGMIVLTDFQGHTQCAFVWGGFAEVTATRVIALADRTLPPEDLSREMLDKEIANMEAVIDSARTDIVRRDAVFARSRLQHVREALSF